MANIKNFPDYTITACGKIVSHGRRALKPTVFKRSGHLYVTLCNNGKQKRCWVHRLVLETFDRPCPKGMECRHRDGNPANNCLDNLEWATRSANIADRRAHGTMHLGSKRAHSKLCEKDIPIIRALSAGGLSTYTLAAKYKVCQATIWAIVTRKTWTHV